MLNPKSKAQLIRLVKKILHGNADPEEVHFVEDYYDFFELKEKAENNF